jgi:CheY-like chemotaxis protein
MLISSSLKQKTVGKKAGRSKTGSILVLDDEFDLSMLVKQIIQKDAFKNIFAFTDPLLALEHFRINHKDYSLIISDIRMPIMNGFEFVREARKINPKAKILHMTAFEIDDKEFARVLPNPKIDGLIRKPASPKQILSVRHTKGLEVDNLNPIYILKF